ncbi:MAG: aminotransferase class IV [Candidatus Eisenbacteria bacterium]
MTLPLPPGVRVPDKLAWVNGSLVRGEDAVLSLWDRGARDGGAIFETVRTYAGEPFAWERHIERLVISAAELGFPVPPSPSRLRNAVADLLAAQSLTDAVVRITVTRGIPGGRPTRTGAWIEAESVPARLWAGQRAVSATAILSAHPFAAGWLGRHKTTSRMAWDLAREEARAAGVDEAVLVSPEGLVLEGAASNLFVVIAGEILTPSISLDVLAGVARAITLGLCAEHGIPAHEAAIPLATLHTADEVILTNSVQEILPVGVLDGRKLPSRELGLKLRDAYRALTIQT